MEKEVTNEIDKTTGGSAGRIRRLRTDDPRFSGLVEWSCKQGFTESAQAQILAGFLETLQAHIPCGTEDEVREPCVAEEIQGREVQEVSLSRKLWDVWVGHYGLFGARSLATQAGLKPLA